MLHKKIDFDSSGTSLGEEDQRTQAEDYRITDQDAVRCALSIPEEFVPTPHTEFIKDLEVKQESQNLRRKERPIMLSPKKVHQPSIQNGDGEYRLNSMSTKTLLVRERERKLRSAFAKYKKWDENERCKVEKLQDNKVLINDNMILDNIDHTNYIKEVDVILELDEDWRTCLMPPLPPIPETPEKKGVEEVGGKTEPEEECDAPSCRLGCICQSIKKGSEVRTHCGKARCFFECNCQQSLFNNGDDTDIRSRLRPRVSLLNWRFMETTERDKDPPPANYRQLERGVAVYPRMRRVAVAPQRFRNEYIMSSKYKDTFGRERRQSVVSGGIAKFIRKQTVPTVGVKRDSPGSIYRRSYLVKSTSVNKPKDTSISGNINKCRPCTVSIDQLKGNNNVADETPGKAEQTPLKVPNLIRMIQRDGLIILMGLEKLCFVTFSLRWEHPRAIVYKTDDNEIDIPWLYLPFPSYGETWLFHPIEDLADTTFTYIPEVNCVIPSKALQLHINMSKTKSKPVSLKMLWIGQDSKKRCGHIYILPALPNVLVCGPFPRGQIVTRFNPDFNKMGRTTNVGSYLDTVTASKRFMGDEQSWNSFFMNKNEKVSTALKENLIKVSPNGAGTQKLLSLVPKEIMESVTIAQCGSKTNNTPSSPPSFQPIVINPKREKFNLSWNEASKMLSVVQP